MKDLSNRPPAEPRAITNSLFNNVYEGLQAMKVVPLGDKLVVKRLDSAEKTLGGIVLPDGARDKPQQGRVLSVGDGPMLPNGTRVAHEVNEGDRVVFGSYAGSEVSIDDEKLLILSADDVLAIVR